MKTPNNSTKAKLVTFEILKPGRFTDMSGVTHEFSEAQLKRIAEVYNPTLHEAPLVFGHPKTDAPSYGWTKQLAFQDGVLCASAGEIVDGFDRAMVTTHKKRSASFYPPNSPNNPTPGELYLKHIGFLGATPPAVKGLRDVQFSENDDSFTIELSDFNVAVVLQSIREFLISKHGVEEVDKVIPAWNVQNTLIDAAREEAQQGSAFAETEDAATKIVEVLVKASAGLSSDVRAAVEESTATAVSEALAAAFPDLDAAKVKEVVTSGFAKLFAGTEDAPSPFEAALKASLGKLGDAVKEALPKQAEQPAKEPPPKEAPPADAGANLSEANAALAAREAAVTKREAKLKRDAHISFLDGVAKEGKRLPFARDRGLDLLAHVDQGDISFGEGDDKQSPLELTQKLISALPKQVDFSERGAPEGSDFADDD
ncbi:MAG TPA: hypothetical protein VHO25_12640, partial [Polyangiaceae bacterium]|nr:hypothetical protein [Polyangiaceae bacterium]